MQSFAAQRTVLVNFIPSLHDLLETDRISGDQQQLDDI
jgi:hypothetical protein